MEKQKFPGIENPKQICNDPNCAFHGNVAIRGRRFSAKVVSAKAQKTVTVEWDRKVLNRKYERFQMKRTRVKAHNSECVNAKEGDMVQIGECRPLSKTKHFIVLTKIVQ